MTLISQRQIRINAGLPSLKRDLPAKDRELYSALESAKKAITSILKSVDPGKIKCQTPNDLYKTSVALSALLRAQVDYERWSAERIGLLSEAVEEVRASVQAELEEEPELYTKLLELLRRVEARREAEKGAVNTDT